MTGDGSSSDLPSSTSLFTSPKSNPIDIELDTPTNILVQHPFISSNLSSSSPTINDEDALINRISSLLASHLLSRQSASITSHIFHEHETNSNLSDSAISLSNSGTTGPINTSVRSNQSSPSTVINDFDKLLQRIKTAVDNRLSIETNNINNNNQQLLALHAVSCEETHIDDYDIENSTSSNRKHKLDLSSKSQSFDATNLSKHSINSLTFLMLTILISR